MNQILKIDKWCPDTQTETTVVVELEAVIRNPAGFKLDQLGLQLLNEARRNRGLTEYQYNLKTNTFDEIATLSPEVVETIKSDPVVREVIICLLKFPAIINGKHQGYTNGQLAPLLKALMDTTFHTVTSLTAYLNSRGYRNSKGRKIKVQYVSNGLIVYCGYRKNKYGIRNVKSGKASVKSETIETYNKANIEKSNRLNPHKLKPHTYPTKDL